VGYLRYGIPPHLYEKMPIYTFKSKDGEQLEELVSNSTTRKIKRNGKVYLRNELPEAFAVTGQVRSKSFAESMKAGYYKAECEGGSRFSSNYSKGRIKKVWGL
jgi:hypothetical protein